MNFCINRFSNIERKTYEVEIITPMFLGGADTMKADTMKAELRIPPIKGMLRFWWRALHPDLANNNYDSLRKEESGLFGDAGDTYGKSPVKIQFSDINNSLSLNKFSPLPHSDTKKFQFVGFQPASNSKFKIIITGSEKIHKLFEFSLIVGGLGKRSRRGFGSLLFKSDDDANLIDKLLGFIKEINPQNIYKKSDNKEGIEISKDYSEAHYPYLKKIQIGKENTSYDNLLKIIGNSSHINDSDYTGFVRGRNRFSSPIYVSITKKNNAYIPVISTLNLAFDLKHSPGKDKSKSFIADIITGKEGK